MVGFPLPSNEADLVGGLGTPYHGDTSLLQVVCSEYLEHDSALVTLYVDGEFLDFYLGGGSRWVRSGHYSDYFVIGKLPLIEDVDVYL